MNRAWQMPRNYDEMVLRRKAMQAWAAAHYGFIDVTGAEGEVSQSRLGRDRLGVRLPPHSTLAPSLSPAGTVSGRSIGMERQADVDLRAGRRARRRTLEQSVFRLGGSLLVEHRHRTDRGTGSASPLERQSDEAEFALADQGFQIAQALDVRDVELQARFFGPASSRRRSALAAWSRCRNERSPVFQPLRGGHVDPGLSVE